MSTIPTPSEFALNIYRNPWGFIKQFFGEEPKFDKQREILEALRDYNEVLVPSCHDSGKTFTAARALLWFLLSHPKDCIVLSTAPTYKQVTELLWKEVALAISRAKFPLFNAKDGHKVLQTSLELAPKWYATGITSDDPVNYTGFHASNLLCILDEADGIAKPIWDALEGVLTSGNAKLLAIGNPLDPTSQFASRVRNAQAPKTKVIRITDDDVLPVTDGGHNPFLLQRSWVEDKKRLWGENSSLYMGKIKAQWSDSSVDTLIPLSHLLRAKGRSVERGILTYGVDVARFGTNRTVRTLIAGNQLLSSVATEKEDTVETATRVINDIRRFEPVMSQIDETGVGAGVLDQVRRQIGREYQIRGVNNGGKAINETKFANRAAEMWWSVREAFEKDQIGLSMSDPDAVEELINDLNRPTYSYNRHQKLMIDKFGLPRGTTEFSLNMEERAAASPDRADSFVLSYTAAKPYITQGRVSLNRSKSYMPRVPIGGVMV